MKEGAAIPMCFRLATEADVKPDGRVQSRWLWRGGEPPRRARAATAAARAARASRKSGGKRRRGRGRGEEQGEEGNGYVDFGDDPEPEMDIAVERPAGDLREALKRRRAEAPPAEGAEGAAAEGAGGAEGTAAAAGEGAAAAADADAMEVPARADAAVPPAELPAGDLRTSLLASAVPDFGDDEPTEAA